MADAKVQHYVPQFLLRRFGTGKKDRLHVFDKQTGGTFATRARNVAAESRFYDFEFEGQPVTAEPGLAKLETLAKPLIQRMLDEDTLATLSAEDLATLSVFFAIQFIRTRSFRENWRQVGVVLGDWLRRQAHTEEELSAVADYIRIPDENDTVREAVRFMHTEAATFAAHFVDKTWVLLRTDRTRPFLIGDNPITLQNQRDSGPRGNLGLAVPGIEIYFPLSPVRALAFWCPSHESAIRDAATRRGSLPRPAQDLITAINTGRPLASAPENVENFNSLQIRYAERYVFSSVDDFALARDMVVTHPETRTGPRIQWA